MLKILSKQGKYFIVGGIIVLAILAGIFCYYRYRGQKSNDSGTAKTEAPGLTNIDISVSPVSGDILLKNAQNSYQQKDYSGAESSYKQIINQDAKNKDAILGLANTYRDWGKTDLAIAQYNQSIQDFPQEVSAYIGLSQVYKATNQIDKAKEALNNGLKNNPGDISLQNSLDILEISPSSAEGK